jgi:CRP-like cAMP-binding protein
MLSTAFNLVPLLTRLGRNRKPAFFRKKQTIFSYRERSDSIFYVDKGTVKVTIPSVKGNLASLAA